jgi:hypothetical protein
MSTQAIDPSRVEGEVPPAPERGEQKPAAAATNGGAPESPWGELSEDEQRWLRNKGWNEPGAVLKAYRELESLRGKESEELSEWRQFGRQLSERESQAQQQHAPQGQQQGLDWKALAAQCMDENGEFDPGVFGSIIFNLSATTAYQAAEAKFEERLKQFETERVAPLVERFEVEQLGEQLAQLEGFYGERFSQVSAEADTILEEDPEMIERVGARAVFAEAAARLAEREESQRRREADGFTLGPSGRRSERRLTPAEREVALMEQMVKRPRDGL